VIVTDTSALLAIVFGEPDAERYRDVLVATSAQVSAATLTEARMVVESRVGLDGTRDLELLIETAEVTLLPYTGEHAIAAHDAWRRFGKGRHPAGLNFGDCISYATAVVAECPLLFKGDDFTQTDIPSAL